MFDDLEQKELYYILSDAETVMASKDLIEATRGLLLSCNNPNKLLTDKDTGKMLYLVDWESIESVAAKTKTYFEMVSWGVTELMVSRAAGKDLDWAIQNPAAALRGAAAYTEKLKAERNLFMWAAIVECVALIVTLSLKTL